MMISKLSNAGASLGALAVALLLSACGDDFPDTKASIGVEVGDVLWPELIAFEKVALAAQTFAENRNRQGILDQRTEILEAGWAVSPATTPENVPNHDRVHQLLGDLTKLVNGLAQSEMSDERLFALAEGLHPAAKTLIEVSGIAQKSTK
jgi:hypothetical protein